MRLRLVSILAVAAASCSFNHSGISTGTPDVPISTMEATVPPETPPPAEAFCELCDVVPPAEAPVDMFVPPDRPPAEAPVCQCGASCGGAECFAQVADTCTSAGLCACGAGAPCGGGQSCCGGTCSSAMDTTNCGYCGLACGSGAACTSGFCSCGLGGSPSCPTLAPPCSNFMSTKICVCHVGVSSTDSYACNPRLSSSCDTTGMGQCKCGGAPQCDFNVADHCDTAQTPPCRCGNGPACTGGAHCVATAAGVATCM